MKQLCRGVIVDDRFELVEELGDGGMGCVYKAHHIELDCDVAIKFLHEELIADEDSLSRFQREGKLLSSMQHPNLVRCYRVGVALLHQIRLPYIALELVDGTSLRTVLQENGALNWRQACQVAWQVCEAMNVVHEKGVIHRDLKPNNIMIAGDPGPIGPGTVKVLDFGLARLIPQDGAVSQHLTQTGALVGTVYYLSPEQCLGRRADERSDIYSLGCVLYECLSGAPPLVSENPIGIVHKHAHEYPAPIDLQADMPAALNDVLFKAMAKNPSQRYANMDEFASDLMRLVTGDECVHASHFEPNQVKSKEAPKRWRKFWTRIGFACALVAVCWLFLFRSGFDVLVSLIYPAAAASMAGTLEDMIRDGIALGRIGLRQQASWLLNDADQRLLKSDRMTDGDICTLAKIALGQKEVGLSEEVYVRTAGRALLGTRCLKRLNKQQLLYLGKMLDLLCEPFEKTKTCRYVTARSAEFSSVLFHLCDVTRNCGDTQAFAARVAEVALLSGATGGWHNVALLENDCGNMFYDSHNVPKAFMHYKSLARRIFREHPDSPETMRTFRQIELLSEECGERRGMFEVSLAAAMAIPPKGFDGIRAQIAEARWRKCGEYIHSLVFEKHFSEARERAQQLSSVALSFPVSYKVGMECYYSPMFEYLWTNGAPAHEEAIRFVKEELRQAEQKVSACCRNKLQPTNPRAFINHFLEHAPQFPDDKPVSLPSDCYQALWNLSWAKHLLADYSASPIREQLYSEVLSIRSFLIGTKTPLFLATFANFMGDCDPARQQLMIGAFESEIVEEAKTARDFELTLLTNSALNVASYRVRHGQFKQALAPLKATLSKLKSLGTDNVLPKECDIYQGHKMLCALYIWCCCKCADSREAYKIARAIAEPCAYRCVSATDLQSVLVPILTSYRQCRQEQEAQRLYNMAYASLQKSAPPEAVRLQKWWAGRMDIIPFKL